MTTALYTATLLVAMLPSTATLRVILPNGSELSAQRVVLHPDAALVVIEEGAILRDGFE